MKISYFDDNIIANLFDSLLSDNYFKYCGEMLLWK